MLFAVIRNDHPNSGALRQSARPMHLKYLETVMDCITGGGALLDDSGQQVGSILFIEVADRNAAEHFAAIDPFVAAGLFASTTILPFRNVFKDGRRIDAPIVTNANRPRYAGHSRTEERGVA